MSEIERLLETVRDIREEEYPGLPLEVVEAIVKVEHENFEDEARALREVKKIIEEYVESRFQEETA